MDNCGGGGQRLPPDGDEFPAAYQEFTSPSQQYQYVTTRETMAANGDVDRGESVVDSTTFIPAEKAVIVTKTLNVAETRGIFDKKDMTEFIQKNVEGEKKTPITSSYVLYSTQKNIVPNLIAEKKIEIAAYYPKENSEEDDLDVNGSPPPLPLTRPPKIDARQGHERKFSANGDLWRQDNKSEKSVKDKIAMFSSQSSLEAPLFPTSITATVASCNTPSSSPRRLSKHKSSDDVFADDKKSTITELTQSSFDLSVNYINKKSSSLSQISPPASPSELNGYSNGTSPIHTLQKSAEVNDSKYSPISSSASSSKSSSPLSSYSTAYGIVVSPIYGKSFDATPSSLTNKASSILTRAISFSGSLSPYATDKVQTSTELLVSTPSIARTNSLASTFKRPNDEMRKSSLNQLIEQRRKGISKLRGLVIPEKDAVSVDRPIIDLPEIKSRESILVNNQMPRSNIQDKWGSQSSLASNASTVSSSMRTNTSFKMPAPKILSSYSPAFKRKSLTVYNNTQSNDSPVINGSKTHTTATTNNQLSSPASDAPKSLESICSPTRSDYSFDFVSSSGSPENNHPASKLKLNCQRKIGRNEYDDSDNDSAVSSSQSSISRGFSPPTSPVPSDRSTISSERSYLSSEMHYQRTQLILDNKTNSSATVIPEKFYNTHSLRSNMVSERSFSIPENPTHIKPVHQSQPTEQIRSSCIPQRQMLKRSSSTETNSSNSSTLTSGSHASVESLSRRVLKPQSVEAINRKNILASARCRSGRDLNGSPLIQRKFTDDEENTGTGTDHQENGIFVDAHRMMNGNNDCTKPEIKVAYIEITENVTEGDKFTEQKKEEPPPRLPPKRSIIPQAKSVPIPTSRPPKPEVLEPSNDIKSWVRSEMRNLTTNSTDRTNSYDSRKKASPCDIDDTSSHRNFRSKSSLTLNEQSPSTTMGSRSQSIDAEGDIDLIDSIKPKSRSNFAMKKTTDNDLLAVLTTKSRSRSAIHIEDSNYGKLKSQMSLEDILTVKNNEPPTTKFPRSLSISSDTRTTKKINDTSMYSSTNDSLKNECTVKRSISTDLWSEEKIFFTKIPSLNNRTGKLLTDNSEDTTELSKLSNNCSKIPMSRNLGRRSSSVTDMKKVFEKVDHSLPTGVSTVGSQSINTASHNRFPSLDSSVEETIRPVVSNSNNSTCEPDTERSSWEQFGSISSLASSTSLISQQELAQLVEEANLEEPRGGHDLAVVLLHKENPAGSVGIILAGGTDCETKEITIHRVLTHSIADKEGSVQRGDRILSINGRSMRGLTHRESLAVLKQPRSEVVLVVSRARAENNHKGETATSVSRLRSRAGSVETIVEGCKTNGVIDNTAWGPPIVVEMYKDGTGLGFSLEGGHDSPLGDRPLLIKKIFTGGAAEKTGALEAGDQLLEVNNRDVSRMSRIEAWSLMKKLPDGEVSLLVRHPATKSS